MKSYPSSELRNVCDERPSAVEPAEEGVDLLQQMLDRRSDGRGCLETCDPERNQEAKSAVFRLSCDLLRLTRRHAPYPNLYPDQSPSEEWTMEERFRPLTFHGLVLRSQLVTLLTGGVCYAENESVRHARARARAPRRWGAVSAYVFVCFRAPLNPG